jgi:hypothetical protein
MVVVAVVAVDHTLPGNWDKFVVDIEDNIVVVAAYKYHWMMYIVDQVSHRNVILVVGFVVRDRLLGKHALYDYFQYLMTLIVHWVYHRYFVPEIN